MYNRLISSLVKLYYSVILNYTILHQFGIKDQGWPSWLVAFGTFVVVDGLLIKSISNHNPYPAITAEWGFLFAMKQST